MFIGSSDNDRSHSAYRAAQEALPESLTGDRSFGENNADLGLPVDSPRAKAWMDEVHRRRCEQGIELIILSDSLRRMPMQAGCRNPFDRQESEINPGRSTRAATLGPRDVVLLLAYRRRSADPSQSEPE